jgi:electron transport complex protein RnfG
MESLKLVAVLTIICTVAGALLAVVHDVTEAPIAAAAAKEKGDAIMAVLPACDNQPVKDAITIEADGTSWSFYVAREKSQFVGAAFEAVSTKGYGGDIAIMVGVNADGTVQAIEVLLGHKETPGLGAWITGDAFRGQFAGRSIADTHWAVKKDGGDIDQITAATISSRAVTDAVKAGLAVYTANSEAIAGVPDTQHPTSDTPEKGPSQ